MKNLILGILAYFGVSFFRVPTRDAAFQYRMGAGFPGDVNRTHPASIEPCLIDEDDPVVAYGYPVLVDAVTQGVRGMVAGDDSVTTIWGVAVRPFPFQQQAATNYGAVGLGDATPPVDGVMDILRSGYIMTRIPAGQSPVKGGAVYVWTSASAGDHIQGGFEAVDGGADTASLDAAKYQFNGSPDASGNVEICVNV